MNYTEEQVEVMNYMLDAERWREFSKGNALTVKMKNAVVIFGPNKERDYAAALNHAIDNRIAYPND